MSVNPQNALWREMGRAVAGRGADLRSFDPASALEAAKFNGVCALLAWRQGNGGTVAMGADLVRALTDIARVQAMYDLALIAATRRFIELLDREGIGTILLKGSALSCLHYPESHLRLRSDIDLAIPESRAADVIALLEANGYRLANHEVTKLSSGQFQASRERFRDEGLWFDIHLRMSNRGVFRDCFSFDDLDAHRQPVAKLGPAARAPSNVHLLIHGAMHRAAHGRGTHTTRLHWLYDLALLFEAMDSVEREAFVREALDRRMGAVCADALDACEAAFGMEWPAEIRSELLGNASDEPSAKLVDASRISWALSDLMQQHGLGGKLRFAGELLSNQLRGMLPPSR